MTQTEHIKTIIGSFVHNIEPTARVLLYGSRARGDNNQNSDWDVAIIVDNGLSSFANTKKLGYPLFIKGIEIGVEINASVYTPKQWERGKQISNFYWNVEKDGVVL